MRLDAMDTQPEVAAKSLTELVAEEIRVVLARRQMRQSELARTLGVTEQWLSVRLRGLQPIDLNDLARIAAGLQVAVTELLPGIAAEVGAEPEARSQPMRSRPHARARRGADTTPRYSPGPDRVIPRSPVRPSNRGDARTPRDSRPKGRAASAPTPPNLRRPVPYGSTPVSGQ